MERSAVPSHASGSGRKNKRANEKLLDLDGEDDDAEGDDGMMEREKKFGEALKRELSRCQACGPSRVCKIANDSTHIKLSHNQLRAWSVALVCAFNVKEYLAFSTCFSTTRPITPTA